MWSAGPAPQPLSGIRHGALNVRLGLQPGMRVGLFGGSFDPAHAGHAHVAETALKRLGLDRVIWLVSPGNPLKPHAPAELKRRMDSARAAARGPRMVVSDAESRLGVRYTIDTIRALKARYPGVDFVWIMGADSLKDLHRWRGWTQLMDEIPMAIIARPGSAIRSRLAPAARRYAHARAPSGAARRLAGSSPPAWTFLRAPWNYASSTALRQTLAAH
ncbi:MAG TPA: nicotinate-nucleotide adenylyltransferase [Caulobacteraceae bacterium]|nr:nicotinate-nucleotide adenylyltransferase [Caulobacteraceae bacterium]